MDRPQDPNRLPTPLSPRRLRARGTDVSFLVHSDLDLADDASDATDQAIARGIQLLDSESRAHAERLFYSGVYSGAAL